MPAGTRGASRNCRCRRARVDRRKLIAYVVDVIQTFKSKALSELWSKGGSAKIDAKMHRRILARLDRLDVSTRPEEMNLPGFDFPALHGFDPRRYSVHVNGPWCITFEFENGDACRVDFEQYH